MLGVSRNLQSDSQHSWREVDNFKCAGGAVLSYLPINTYLIALPQRIKYWLVVGAQPSERVAVLLGMLNHINFLDCLLTSSFSCQVRQIFSQLNPLTVSPILMLPSRRRRRKIQFVCKTATYCFLMCKARTYRFQHFSSKRKLVYRMSWTMLFNFPSAT